jgi:cytochrome c556
MNKLFAMVAVAAVIVTAACNGGGGDNQASGSNEQSNDTATNVASGAGAQQDLEAAMRTRHERYEEMGRAMKGIGQQLKASSPDVAVIQQHSALIARYAPQVPSWFPAGTEAREGRRTRAKAEIWSDPAGFRTAADRFTQAATAFDQAARSGDLAAIREGRETLGETCGNCHDHYRAREHGRD